MTTRGKYYPDKSLATEKDPPLYLHITAASQESLDEAVKKIEEMMEQFFNTAPTQNARHGASQHSGGVSELIHVCLLFSELVLTIIFNTTASICSRQSVCWD